MSEVTDDQMSPDASPGGVSKRAGVRRVNNMPMYIVGGLMAVFLLIMVLVAADRAAKQHRPAEVPPEKAGNTSMFAKEIAGDRQDGIIRRKARLLSRSRLIWRHQMVQYPSRGRSISIPRLHHPIRRIHKCNRRRATQQPKQRTACG